MTIPPPTRVHVRSVVVLLILLTPMVVRTTSPALPPYHEFIVSGDLVRTGGGSVENFTIGIAEKRLGWSLLREGARPQTITTEDGSFVVRAQTLDPTDSIAVAVILPGEDPLIADTFAIADQRTTTIEGWFTPVTQSDGCCEDDPAAVKRVEGYIYYVDNETITIP